MFLISGIQSFLPLLEFLRKRSTQVPYTCRKCIKDQKSLKKLHINFRVLKKEDLSLAGAVSNRIIMFVYLLVVFQLVVFQPKEAPSFSRAPRDHHITAVTSNLVQSSHVEMTVVKRFKSFVLPQTPGGKTESARKEV